ncbi:MAG: hypothetical protein GX939_04465 [Clostridiaceae bacterium]|nr:hypothetical protein [Clostridiaceae bacterium]
MAAYELTMLTPLAQKQAVYVKIKICKLWLPMELHSKGGHDNEKQKNTTRERKERSSPNVTTD